MVTLLDENTTLEGVRSLLAKERVAALIAVASFSSPSKVLVEQLKQFETKSQGGCCGGSPYDILILSTDASEDMEDIALDLGLDGIPSFQIYKYGILQPGYNDLDERTVTSERILDALDLVSKSNGDSCCSTEVVGGGVACCPNPNEEQPIDASDVLRLVQQSYANTVNKSPSGCCVSVDPNLNAYNMDEMVKAGAANANLGLGCGNPLTFSAIQEGETVVDLGSGAGVDCFLASVKVGAFGTVIGVDMTPDMIATARSNSKMRLQKGNRDIYDNVQFRLGEIEYLPIADSTVDCIISNCVINLSPNKAQVFREMFRVLKPGGRIAVCDVVNRPQIEIPNRLKTAAALACWVSGAPKLESLQEYLAQAGFTNVKLKLKEESRNVISQWLPGSGAENYVISAEITARK